MSKYYHRSIYNLYLAKSEIPNAGLGVFTRDFIPKDSYIDEYLGDIYDFQPVGSYVMELAPDYYIDAENFPRCYMAMLNDCSYIEKKIIKKRKRQVDITPTNYIDKIGRELNINCKFIKNKEDKIVEVYSIADIEPDTELFVWYGDNYWI